MLKSYEAFCDTNDRILNERLLELLERARKIVGRLIRGSNIPQASTTETESLALPNIQQIPITAQVVPIVEARLDEARVALRTGAHLSVILLYGCVLEAVLLGAAQQDPARFNQASITPKRKGGSPKRFHEWSLAQLIDVACEVGVLTPDVKKFSHGLRDFRNYIHPYEQMTSGFRPDEHTAKICCLVLRAALANLGGERP